MRRTLRLYSVKAESRSSPTAWARNLPEPGSTGCCCQFHPGGAPGAATPQAGAGPHAGGGDPGVAPQAGGADQSPGGGGGGGGGGGTALICGYSARAGPRTTLSLRTVTRKTPSRPG